MRTDAHTKTFWDVEEGESQCICIEEKVLKYPQAAV
jgi:hypothetical protein